jgi:hypothetical protein
MRHWHFEFLELTDRDALLLKTAMNLSNFHNNRVNNKSHYDQNFWICPQSREIGQRLPQL